MGKIIIGRREKISFPSFGPDLIWAKIDTGAYTSTLHAEDVRVEMENDKEVLKFVPFKSSDKTYTGKTQKAENFRKKIVKNSFGDDEERFLITIRVMIAGEVFDTEFTLSNRSKMRNSILLGRQTIRGKYLIDVERVNLSKSYRKNQAIR
ncbi:ATP-dependent zinc protease [Algoriphagus namhaensis]|uniref:ATP-dependent zinc protease n=1 Tax=Algoriphagus namhaensis TaxID=915353 RepID=A0ABV8AR86_9BACT